MAPSRRQVATGLAVSAGAFVLFGSVTGLVPNPIYTRMVPRTPLDYVFLTLTAGFLGVYSAQRVPDERGREDGLAALGTVGGVLAFGCPICNALLLALFSSSALMTYFDPLRPALGAATVVLFGGLVYYRYSKACAVCEVEPAADAAGDRSTGQNP